jgi:hypothetical protein
MDSARGDNEAISRPQFYTLSVQTVPSLSGQNNGDFGKFMAMG